MKKYLLIPIFVLSNCLAFGQSVNVIQVNEKNEAKHSYLISCIDSIMHDLSRQVQILYIGGNTYEYHIGDIDSITVEKEDVKVFYLPDYIEGTETYFFSNGCAINISEDSINGYTLFIDSLDFKANKWDEDKALALYCDSLFRPIMAVTNKGKVQFSYNNNSIAVKVIDNCGNVYETSDIPMQNNLSTRSYVKRASEDGNWRDGTNNALKIVELARSVIKRDLEGITEVILPDLVPQGIPRDIASSIAGSIGTYFETNIFGRALGLAGLIITYTQLISDLRDWIVKREIGDITPRITNLEQVDNGSVDLRIDFSGDGFLTSTNDIPLFHVNYWQEVDGRKVGSMHRTSSQNANYGFRTERIPNLNGGDWAFQVIVYPSKYDVSDFLVANYNFRSNIVRTNIGGIFISELSQVSDDYSDNTVTLSMRALLEYQSDEDEVILSAYNDYGLYVRRGNKTPELYSVKQNGGLEFFVHFDFTKNELDLNYDTYKATPIDDIKFGVYTINGYGLRKYYDEQFAEMAYSKAPKAQTGDKVSVEKTSAIVKCTYEGCTFWGLPCGIEYGYDDKIESGIVAADYDGEQEIHLTDLTPGKTYTYRAYFEINGKREYGEEKSFKTVDDSLCPNANHPHMIDLGLPSGTKWACCNVGANTPEGFGNYYAWGETQPKSVYNWDTYQYYNDNTGYVNIGSDIAGTGYDAATANWGTPWRMPSLVQIQELLSYTTSTWTTQNGVYGRKFTGSNGGAVFLPAAEKRWDLEPGNADSRGLYWSSTDESYPANAYELYFSSGGVYAKYYLRYAGRSVRPVR